MRKFTKKEYKKMIKNEVCKEKNPFKNIYFKYFYPPTSLIYNVRKMQLHNLSDNIVGRFLTLFYEYIINKKFACCIDKNVLIGYNIKFPHPTGIVLGSKTVIGNNCRIYQNVTVGGARIGDAKKGNQPNIGNNCIIFANSCVLGKINVLDDCIIGANSLLNKSTNIKGVYIGSPAKLVDKNKE